MSDTDPRTEPVPPGATDSDVRHPGETLGLPGAAGPDGPETLPAEAPGRYARLDVIGQGGQSVVWRARDALFQREVALKALRRSGDRTEGEDDTDVRQARFLREARLTAQLDHPAIVAVHDLGVDGEGVPFCTQKLFRGQTLSVALAACPGLSERLRLLPHVLAAAQAVAYAHSRGVVHRDLKPSNVMVDEFGATAVVDWGLAKRRGEDDPAVPPGGGSGDGGVTRVGQALGTPAYMSPEQARGALDQVDERSDVHGLGGILYELVTGLAPFQGASASHVLEAALVGRRHPVLARAPEAPPELAAIVERCLDPDPAGRYPDAEALASDLSAIMVGRPVSAYRYRATRRLVRFVQRHRLASITASGVVLLLAASVLVVSTQLRRTRQTLARAYLDRARQAELRSEWASAALSFAASVAQSDGPEARMGLALALEGTMERVRRASAPVGARLGEREGGGPVLVAVEGGELTASDPVTGARLWTRPLDGGVGRLDSIRRGLVRTVGPAGIHTFGLEDGVELERSDRLDRVPLPGTRASERLWLREGRVVEIEGLPTGRTTIALGSTLTPGVLSRDGGLLATVDEQWRVHVVSLHGERRELATLPADGRVSDIAYCEQGLLVVRPDTLSLAGESDASRFSLALPGPRLQFGFSRFLTVSPDGRRVAVTTPDLFRTDVVDVPARRVVASIQARPGYTGVTFSSDGRALIGLASGVVDVWRLPDAGPVPRLRKVAQAIVVGRGVVGFIDVGPSGGRVRWMEPSGRDLGALEVPPDLVSAALSADGTTLAISTSTTVRAFEVPGGTLRAEFPCERCNPVSLSADGAWMAAIRPGVVLGFDARGRRPAFEERRHAPTTSSPLAVAFDGSTVAWLDGRRTLVVRDATGRLETSGAASDIRGLEPNPREPLLAVRMAGSTEVRDARWLRTLWRQTSEAKAARDIGWSDDGRTLLAQSEGGGWMLWDARTGETTGWIGAPEPRGEVYTVLTDLRNRLVQAERFGWYLEPLPPPFAGTAAAASAEVTRRTGLALEGLDVVSAGR